MKQKATNGHSPEPIPPSNDLRTLGLRTFEQLQMDNRTTPRGWLVDGLLFEESVNISVGDSGLGKSPWHYQLAMAVIHGLEFMGRKTIPGPVVYSDFENSSADIETVVMRLSSHLKLERPEPGRLIHLTDPGDIDSGEKIERICLAVQPRLFIIDPLRCWAPDGESKQENAAKSLQILRTISRRHKTSFICVHHIRKDGRGKEFRRPALQATQAIEWLQEASGARSLINQTDTRIAFDEHRERFVMRYNVRTHGDFGPFHFCRVATSGGDPLGYNWIRGLDVIENPYMRDVYQKLPENSSYTQIKSLYGKSDSSTMNFIRKCEAAGVLQKQSNGEYFRVYGVSSVN